VRVCVCVCVRVDVSVEDSGNYTCEVFGRRSVVLATVTHTVIVRGTNTRYAGVYTYSSVVRGLGGRLA